jgi:hypothetical protein
MVFRIYKSIYHLKHAHLDWYANMDSFLIFIRFSHCNYDPNIYILCHDDSLLYFVFYIDGLLIKKSSLSYIVAMKIFLHDQFPMSD